VYEYRKLTPEQRAKLLQERRERGYPAHQPPHPVRIQGLYLLTAACYEHRPYLNQPERREQVLDLIFEQLGAHGVELYAWVVLQNHYHLLVDVDDFEVLPDVFRRVHGRTSYLWNAEDETQRRKIWFRYSDRAIRSEGHYYTTLNYIHYNPVKHGLVFRPYDWEWSSVHWFLEHRGREWLRDVWTRYPLREYGKTWDDL
jgi:putative transposase